MTIRNVLTFFLVLTILVTGWLMVYGDSCDDDTTSLGSSHTITPSPNSAGWNDSDPVTLDITAADNCGVESIHYILDGGAEETVSAATAAVTVSGEGVHTVEYWAIDNAGNVETPHNTATIKIDKTPPKVPENLAPADGAVTNDTTPTLSWSAPNDAGGSGIKNYRYQVDDDPDFSSPLKNGYTTNTHYTPSLSDGTYYWRVRARDNAGNNGDWTAGRQIVIDTVPPQITCPADITVDNDPGACSAVVTWSAPTAMDNVGVASVICDPPSGSAFPVGTTTVTCTATDLAGNTAECSFEVTVIDIEPPTDPVITSPSHVVGEWSNDPEVEIQASGASDNCGVDGFEYAWNHTPSWTPSHIKMAEETWSGGTFTATSSGDWYFHLATVDNTGNWTSTVHIGPFKIDIDKPGVPGNPTPPDGTITNDTTPTLSWDAPSDSGGSGLKNYRYQVDDDPDFSSPLKNGYTTNTHYTPSLSDGTYYWRVRARDNAGNNGDWTAGRQIVIDTEAPQITCPADITVDNDPGECGVVVTYTVDYDDNCPGATIEQLAGLPSGAQFPVGATTNTFRVTDAAGNTAQCSFTVTVNDVEAPSTVFVSTPSDPDNDPTPGFEWIGTDNNGCTDSSALLYSTKLDGGDWSDWAPITSITLGPLAEGSHTFQVRAKDAAGNIGTPACYSWLLDLTTPAVTIITPDDGAEYSLNERVPASWTAWDEPSGLKSATATAAPGSRIDTSIPGRHDFTVTATDRAGNVTTVTVTYRVVYTVSPGGAAGGGGAAGEQRGGFLDRSVAGGGGTVGIAPLEAIYTVGDLIHAGFRLADAAGNDIPDAAVSCTLVAVILGEKGESYAIINIRRFEYDPDTGLYFLDIPTEGLTPGIYDLWLGFDDGTAKRLRIQLIPAKSD